MTTLFTRHTVADYETWRKVYEDFQPTLKAKGVIGAAVYRSVENPNDLTVVHDFATLAEVRAFLNSPELHAARPAAGVDGEPVSWFAEKA